MCVCMCTQDTVKKVHDILRTLSQVAKEELSRECDYELEATNQRRFRKLLSNTTGFYVPLVVDDILSKRVLTTELVPGNCAINSMFCLYIIGF